MSHSTPPLAPVPPAAETEGARNGAAAPAGGPDLCCVLLLLSLCAALWVPRLPGPLDLRWDGSVYYTLGTSLAEGKGYRMLNEPGEVPAVQFPPGLPALVAAHQEALGTGDPAVVGWWLRWTYCLLFVLYALAVYALARQYLAPRPALLAAVIASLAHHVVFLSDLLCSELPFALAATAFAVAQRKSERATGLALTALCGVIAFLLRTVAVALLAAWVADGLLQRRWKQAALRAALSLVPVVAWQAYVGRVTAGDEYRRPAYPYQRAPYLYHNVTYAESVLPADAFAPEPRRATAGELAGRLVSGLGTVPTNLGEAASTPRELWWGPVENIGGRLGLTLRPPSWVVPLPVTVVGCLTLGGAGAFLARRQWFVPLYLAASITLTCLTGWDNQYVRYLMPLAPFLAVCLLRLPEALGAVPWRWPGMLRKAGAVGFALVVGAVVAAELYTVVWLYRGRQEAGHTHARPLFYYDGAWAGYEAALAWLREHAGPDEVLVTAAPHWAYAQTGRKAVMPPMGTDPATAQRLLDSVPAAYVIVDEASPGGMAVVYLRPVVRANPERWKQVYSGPEGSVQVYRRVP